MKPFAKIRPNVWFGIATALLFGSIFTLSLPSGSEKASPTIFSLLDDLNGTTGEMLQNTETLHASVEGVQQKLGQLNAQEVILQKQEQTGQQLSAALTKQEDLTANGISLMRTLLDREKQTVVTANQVTQQVQTLNQQVGNSAALLNQLEGPLQTSKQQSDLLNQQLDQLLAELNRSQQSFRYFGKVKDILSDPLNLKKLLPQLPQLPQLPLPNVPAEPNLPTPNLPTPAAVPDLPKATDPLLPPVLQDPLKKLLP